MILKRTHKLIRRENTFRRGDTATIEVMIVTYWLLIIPIYSFELIKY